MAHLHSGIGNTKGIRILVVCVFTFIVGIATCKQDPKITTSIACNWENNECILVEGSSAPQKISDCSTEENDSETGIGKPEKLQCTLARKNGPINLPLMTQGSERIYPLNENNGDIILSNGSKIVLSCSPENNYLENFDCSEEIECTSKGLQDTKGNKVTFNQFGCKDRLREDITENGKCFDGFTNISIEFNSPAGRFPLITACHDEKTHNTLFTRHILHGASINSAEKYSGRPTFKVGPFYKGIEPKPQKAYTKKVQKETIEKLVGSSELADEYVKLSCSEIYLARGHMAPDGDFDYGSEQYATYYFVNVFPQWHSINNGNWKRLEVATRKLAAKRETDFEIYTGGFDVLKLKDKDGEFVKIYLAYDGDRMVLPAPRLIWKLVHDMKDKSAVVIIMVNNPHDLCNTAEHIICESICDQITWVKWDFHNVSKGYTYCCDVASFSKQVKYAPQVRVRKLLT